MSRRERGRERVEQDHGKSSWVPRGWRSPRRKLSRIGLSGPRALARPPPANGFRSRSAAWRCHSTTLEAPRRVYTCDELTQESVPELRELIRQEYDVMLGGSGKKEAMIEYILKRQAPPSRSDFGDDEDENSHNS